MSEKMIAGKSFVQWHEELPLLKDIMAAREVFWPNPVLRPFADVSPGLDITEDDVRDAAERLKRFAPYLAGAYPETAELKGLIESPLRRIDKMRGILEEQSGAPLPGPLFFEMRPPVAYFRIHQSTGRHLRSAQICRDRGQRQRYAARFRAILSPGRTAL